MTAVAEVSNVTNLISIYTMFFSLGFLGLGNADLKITSLMNSKDRSFASHYTNNRSSYFMYIKYSSLKNSKIKIFFTMNSANVILVTMHFFSLNLHICF